MERRTPPGVVALAAAVLALTACTGGAPSAGPASGDGTSVSYLIGQPDSPEVLAAIETEMDRFTQESGVEVDLQVIPNSNARTLVQTRLRSGEGPDVFGYDTGPGFAGVLAEAGLLYDLTDHAEEQDWPVYDWARPNVTFDDRFYGIPDQVEQVGLFYNADLFAERGLEPPTSMDSLETAAAAFAADGIIPFAAGNQEGWEGGHMLSMALSSRVGADAMRALVTNESDWDSPEVEASLADWAGFAAAGYLPPSPNAISYDNSNALFYSGDAAMNPTGTWLIQELPENADFEVGFVPFPAPDGPGIPSTALGGGTFMNADSQNVTAALQLMDFLVSPEHGQWEVERYLIPAFPVETSGSSASPLFQQVIDDTAGYTQGERQDVGYNIDVNQTDAFNEKMWDGMQGVIGGSATPAEVAASLQAAAEAG